MNTYILIMYIFVGATGGPTSVYVPGEKACHFQAAAAKEVVGEKFAGYWCVPLNYTKGGSK